MKILASYRVVKEIEIEDSEIQAIIDNSVSEENKIENLYLLICQYGVDPEEILGDGYDAVITGVYNPDDENFDEILWEENWDEEEEN